ncbi:MAG: LuxR C-terminal-related transcriptional regulator, partial [Mycobacterium sp.]|uniref:helix-turn-helix transcriptional regulator n=1 Tax=Mycobacterium sp. TaxID=1785 RepID=UPI003BB0292F
DLRWLSHLLLTWGQTTDALEAGRASLALVHELPSSPQLAWSLVNLADLATFVFDPSAAAYAARAITVGTQLGDSTVVLRARGYAALARVLRTDTGWEDLEAVWRDAAASGVPEEHTGLIGTLTCWTAALHHDVDRADRYTALATEFCREHDLDMFQAFATGARAITSLYRGDWADASVFAEDVLTRPGLLPLGRIMPLITLALIRARRGDRSDTSVAGLLHQALAAGGEATNVLRLGPVWAARAEVAWLAGDDQTALAEAQCAIDASNADTDPWVIEHLRRWTHLAGDSAASARPSVITPYRLEISGDWQAAAKEWTRRGCPYDAALAQLGGDIAAVESALATFRSLGARAAARRAQQRLAQLLGRVPRGRRSDTISDPHGLTRREREVFDLLAEGHNDGEIAAALYISRRTVGNHVSAILAKLGMQNRTQAARAHQERRQQIPDGQTPA